MKRVADLEQLPDAELVARVCGGDGAAFNAIMKRYNQRLYRVARAVLRDDGEAEDVLQEAYMRAFMAMPKFRGEATLATWLTRITLNEALGSVRRRRSRLTTLESLGEEEQDRMILFPLVRAAAADPEASAVRADVRRRLEQAIDELPDLYRIVFVLRDVQEMTIEETAGHLGIRPETVKTRLHRARRLLREALGEGFASVVTDAFPFGGRPCAQLRKSVLQRLGLDAPETV